MTIVLNTNNFTDYDTSHIHDFEPYTHQVGGHCSILKFDGGVCKPLIQRECEFYRTVHKDVPLLASITPGFYGCVVVPSNSTPQSRQEGSNSSGGSNESDLGKYQYYIVLQDLTAGMSKPCVMDMKVT
jgi:hypothetical protein